MHFFGKNLPLTKKFLLTGNVTVNHANIIETEIFVYNLGTMYYIDDVLYADAFQNYMKKPTNPETKSTNVSIFPTSPDVEPIPSEFITETSGNQRNRDVLLGLDTIERFTSDTDSDSDDEEVVTPLALPVKYAIEPPKK